MISVRSETPDESEDDSVPVPTPEEIRERATAIRHRWSAKTRRRRSVNPTEQHWYPPGIKVADIQADLDSPTNN
ncbi:MAG: hypothetical protein KDB22_26190 [Planctomycetales bacterium]|nr:hypothetical protein [Planctomycetales bacterium]